MRYNKRMNALDFQGNNKTLSLSELTVMRYFVVYKNNNLSQKLKMIQNFYKILIQSKE